MKVTGDMGWKEIGASAALHGSVLALALALAAATGPGRRLPGASGQSGGLPGAGELRVFPVALLAGTPGGPDEGLREAGRGRPANAPAVTASSEDPPTLTAKSAAVSETAETAREPSLEPAAPPPAVTTPAKLSLESAKAAERADLEAVGTGAAGDHGEAGAITKGAGRGGATPGAAGSASGPRTGSGGGGSIGPGGSDVIPPSPLHIAVPTLPHGLDAKRAKGASVRLLIYVAESGEVREVKLMSGSGIAAIDESALSAARTMRYAPGSEAGVPASMWTEAEISF